MAVWFRVSPALGPLLILGLAAQAGLAGATVPSLDPTSSRPEVEPSPATGAPAGVIAFSIDADGAPDISLLRLADGSVTRLTSSPDIEMDPDLSPDGRWVAYRRAHPEDGDAADIWLMAADGSGQVDLTNDPSLHNWAPAWSPDGTRIAFSTTRAIGVPQVWTMAPDGSDLQPLSPDWGEYVDWAPDGAQVVYARPPGRQGSYDVVRLDIQSGTETVVSDGPGSQFAPAWSPDGRWIAFQSETGDRFQVVLVDVEDATGEPLVIPGEGAWPVWSPDGLLGYAGPGGIHVVRIAEDRAIEPVNVITVAGDFPSWSAAGEVAG